ncbi:MAG: tyrosine-type recombinase/integrase [Saprospiraceae bacterium]|jgi:integrase/recombinase XerC|tara:strand:+ start:15177 stop:16064 length:888 start_codon:yes stop_codon:yes gene_type:complete
MKELIDNFLLYLSSQKRFSEYTVISYKNDLSSAAKYVLETYEIKDIRKVSFFHIRSYIVDLMKNGMSAKSVNRKISSLRSFYKYLIKKSIVDKNPMLKVISPKIPKRLPDYVSKTDIESLFDSISLGDTYGESRNYIVMLLLYNTGMRKSELIGLTEESIDFAQQRITVLGKGNKQRIIPVTNDLLSKIRKYIQIRNQSFESRKSSLLLTDKGKIMYPKLVYNIVNRILVSMATNTKKSPHILRHTFATHMANNGAELNTIKELLGHASLAATQVYTHNSIEKLKDVYSRSHPKA